MNISAVRKVLSMDAGGAEWIETVPRQGYRFSAPVEVADVAMLRLLRRLVFDFLVGRFPDGFVAAKPL